MSGEVRANALQHPLEDHGILRARRTPARAQHRRHQRARHPLEDHQRQVASAPVMVVVERQRLLSVHGILGVIDIEHQGVRRGGVAGDELIDNGLADAVDIPAIHGVLKAGNRRSGREHALGLVKPEWLVPDTELKHRIMPQGIAIVAILIATSDLVDPLFEQVVQ